MRYMYLLDQHEHLQLVTLGLDLNRLRFVRYLVEQGMIGEYPRPCLQSLKLELH